jgi:tetratricopeptide (TPR) repeat protein
MVDLDRKGLIDQALVEAKTSLFFDPDSNAVIYVGNYACLIKDYASAATAYRKALQNNDEINYHIALAEAYYNDGMPRECISEYKKALFLNPFSWSVHLRLVELYAAMDMDAEAQVECEYLIANFPANEDMKKRLRPIINKITAKRFISTYGAVSINQ